MTKESAVFISSISEEYVTRIFLKYGIIRLCNNKGFMGGSTSFQLTSQWERGGVADDNRTSIATDDFVLNVNRSNHCFVIYFYEKKVNRPSLQANGRFTAPYAVRL